jgi:predicted short-subunit dehydrogenase-like oxidoreductase (DUF2520 family)
MRCDSAILPRMEVDPQIAIVGMGNLGGALAEALRRAGYSVEAVKKSKRTKSAKALLKIRAKVVWFCVPDGEIARAAGALAKKMDWKGKIALHSSGALSSDELEVLRKQGAAVASVHPLMTFVRGSRPLLADVSFAVEGDAIALRVVRRIVKELGGRTYIIRKEDKAAYHAWGTFASPLLTALLVTAEQVAALAGIKEKDVRQRMMPILRQTLANYATLGAAGAFSGPIVRGDADTIQRHLRVLSETPEMRDVYWALARAAVQYLPGKNKGLVETALKFKQ